MAHPADEAPPRGLDEFLKLLAPFPGRVSMAARIGLISALGALVTSMYSLPVAVLAAFLPFFLCRPDRVTSVVLPLAALGLITIVLAAILLVARYTLDVPLWRMAAIALLSFLVLYLGAASKLRTLAPIVAMITGYGLDMLGSVPVGEVSTRGALYTWLVVAVAVAATIAVNLVSGISPRRLATAELARRLRLCAQRLVQPQSDRNAFRHSLLQGGAQIGTWLRLSKLEGSSTPADLAALRQALDSSTAILLAVDFIDAQPVEAGPSAASLAPIVATLQEMAQILEQGGYPLDVALPSAENESLAPAVQAALDELRSAITAFADAAPGDVPPAAKPPPQEKGGVFLPGAFTDPEPARYALKTTCAALFCLILYTQLDWSGIHTCFITCYVVALASAAESVEKISLRIAGCLIGAAMGMAAIVFAMPHLTSVGGLMALVFSGAFVAAWFSVGSPRIAYTGVQIAFAFFLCVLQGDGPEFDLTKARDRVIGILLGTLVSYLVTMRVWPVSLARRIDSELVALLRDWARQLGIADRGLRRAAAAKALAQQAAIEQDLGILRFEPERVHPEPAWVEVRWRIVGQLDRIKAPLYLISAGASVVPAIEAKLGAGAANIAGGEASAAPVATTVAATDTEDDRALAGMIERQLADIAQGTHINALKETLVHAPA
jgi:multidrug resistance protein MdtO